VAERARKKSSSVRIVFPRPEPAAEPAFGEAELRAVDALLDALEARGIVFARAHGGDGGLERVDLPRARLVALALGREAPLPELNLAPGEVLLGESAGFFYVGTPSGRVESRSRHGAGTTGFGDRGYWALARSWASFTDGLRLTDEGKRW
jgi:hypothetical protein